MNPFDMSAKEPRTSTRQRAMRKSILLSCAIGCCLGEDITVESHLHLGHVRRRRRGQAVTAAPTEAPTAPIAGDSSSKAAPTSPITGDSSFSQDNSCPPSFTGYHPLPGCRKYYRCRKGSRSSTIEHECVDGLLFDESTGICNWADQVTCSVLESADSQPIATFSTQELPPPSDKEVIGYWQGQNPLSSSVTPDQLDYTKLTRINYATFTTDVSGNIYMTNLVSEVDLLTLIGPKIWYVQDDGSSKEYCLANPHTAGLSCSHHDYSKVRKIENVCTSPQSSLGVLS